MLTYTASTAGSLHATMTGPDGAPVITFSNSLMTDTRLWDRQVAALAGRYRILRYDQRGHGLSAVSAASAADYTLDDLADDIVALWDRLGIQRSHLVGISMGGMTALGAAIRAPERLLSCTMCSMRADAPLAFQRSWDERIAIARDQGMAALAEPTLARWFAPDFDDRPVLDLVGQMIAETPTAGFLGGVNAICGLDYLGIASSSGVPMQFLVGGEDGVLPAAMEELARSIPSSRLQVIAGAGHLINLEQPETFNTAITDFVDLNQAFLS